MTRKLSDDGSSSSRHFDFDRLLGRVGQPDVNGPTRAETPILSDQRPSKAFWPVPWEVMTFREARMQFPETAVTTTRGLQRSNIEPFCLSY